MSGSPRDPADLGPGPVVDADLRLDVVLRRPGSFSDVRVTSTASRSPDPSQSTK